MQAEVMCGPLQQYLSYIDTVTGLSPLMSIAGEGQIMPVKLKLRDGQLTVTGMDTDRSMKITCKVPRQYVTGQKDGEWLVAPEAVRVWARMLDAKDTDTAVLLKTGTGRNGVIRYKTNEIKVFSLGVDTLPELKPPASAPLVVDAASFRVALRHVYSTATSPSNDRTSLIYQIHAMQDEDGLWLEATERTQLVRSMVRVVSSGDTPANLIFSQESCAVLGKLVSSISPDVLKIWESDGRLFIAVGEQANLVILTMANAADFPELVSKVPASSDYTQSIVVDVKAWEAALRTASLFGNDKHARLSIDLSSAGVFMYTTSDLGSIRSQVDGAVWEYKPLTIKLYPSVLKDKLAICGQPQITLFVPEELKSLLFVGDDLNRFSAWVMPFSVDPLEM